MSYQRVMSDGTVCRTGPTCKRHGSGKANAAQVASLQEKISSVFVKPIDNQPIRANSQQLVDQALTSSLTWDGEKPAWWAGFAADVENNELLASTPELLDVIDSPAGPLAVVWTQESIEKRDKISVLSSGVSISGCYFKSVETGEALGYVKMQHTDDASIERSFGDDEFTPFRYASRYSGHSYPFDEKEYVYGDRNLKGEALLEKRREVWIAVCRATRMSTIDSNGEYVAYYNITEEHVPDDATVKKDLKKFAKKIQPQITEAKASAHAPFVDFSRVEEPLKGKGYGTALYVYTARALGREGKVLRGSGLQSDFALKVWDNFRAKMPNNVSTIDTTYKGEKKTSPVLDFTK